MATILAIELCAGIDRVLFCVYENHNLGLDCGNIAIYLKARQLHVISIFVLGVIVQSMIYKRGAQIAG